MSQALPNYFDNRLVEGDEDADYSFFFPDWLCGCYFYDNKLVVESTQQEKDAPKGVFNAQLYEFDFPSKFKILKTTGDSITIGIKNEIEITYIHPNPGKYKATYKIYSDKWASVDIALNTEADVTSVLGKQGSTLKSGVEHNFVSKTDRIDAGGMNILKPPEVDLSVKDDVLTIQVPEDATYPFEFDPTIDINVGNFFIGVAHTEANEPHFVRTSYGRLWTCYANNIFEIRVAYSDDDGNTWTTELVEAGANVYSVYMTMAIDGNDEIWIHYTTGSPLYVKERGRLDSGVWQPATTVHTDAFNWLAESLDVGPNNVRQATIYFFSGASSQAHYCNSTNWATTLTPMGVAMSLSTIAIDENNNAHIVTQSGGNVAGQGYRLIYTLRDWATSVFTTEDIIIPPVPTGRYYFPSLVLDSNGIPHIAFYGDPNFTSLWEVWYANRIGGVWTTIQMTTMLVSQMFVSIGINAVGDILIIWSGLGYGVNPTNYNLQYRFLRCGGTFFPPLTDLPFVMTDVARQQLIPNALKGYHGKKYIHGQPFTWTDVDGGGVGVHIYISNPSLFALGRWY